MSNAKSRAEKEREKQVQEKVQLILGAMLKEDDNRYCVDCDSKGPRWASWNLGVFLCIRCAGIHRNLGVHISKVKSVNLDSWTPQQVASMQMMGNSKGRAVYEANLPSDYRRPQNDQAVEAFIRQKYEKKKYIAAEWVPSKPPDFPVGWDSVTPASLEKNKPEFKKLNLPASKAGADPVKAPVPASQPSKPQPQPSKPVTQQPQPQLVKSVAPALSSSVVKSASSSLDTDLLGLSISSPSSAASSSSSTIPSSASAQDLLGLNSEFSGFVSASVPSAASSDSKADLTDNSLNTAASDGGKMSKDSIMALFGSKSSAASPSPLVNNMPQQQQQQQQQFGSFQQFGQPQQQMPFGQQQNQQFGQPQVQQQQQMQFGQFQSPSMFPQQQQQLPQQQQHNFLSGGSAPFGQPAAGQPAQPQNNDMFDFFNSKPSQINNNQTPANNPFLGLSSANQLNGLNGLNLGNTGPSLFQ